jgi:AcrR family transcriptional regulator
LGRPKEITDAEIVAGARRCFIERGTGVSAVEIARELGISHTTIFNRFGSKEGLMLASLGPPEEASWIAALDAGPDQRAICTQLVAHAKAMSAYFSELQVGLSLLDAAGIDLSKKYRSGKGESSPDRAFRALVGWLERAQKQGRTAKCDVETLAATILGALLGGAFKARVTGKPVTAAAHDTYIERFIDLLWHGISNE